MKAVRRVFLVLALLAVCGWGTTAAAAEPIPDAWKSMDLAALTAEAQRLRGTVPLPLQDCQTLGSYVAQRYASAAAEGKLNIREWLDLALTLSPYLPADTRQAMVKEILAKIVPDSKAIADLSADDLQKVCLAFTGLEGLKDQSGAIASTWVQGSDKYKELSLGALLRIASYLGWAGDAGKGARDRLAEHVENKYLADADTIRQMPIGDWTTLTQRLADGLTDQARGTWAEKLYAAFTSDAALGKMSFKDCNALTKTLQTLKSPLALTALPRWVEKTTQWQEAAPEELVQLAGGLAQTGEAGKAARALVVDQVERKYLVDAASIASVPLATWNSFATSLGKDLSPQGQAAWAEKLYGAFTSDAALAKLASADCNTLAGILQSLGSKQGSTILPLWVEKTKQWRAATPEELVRLVNDISRSGEAGRNALAQLLSHVEVTYLAGTAAVTSVTCNQWWDLVRLFAEDLSPDAGRSWVGKLRAAYVDDAKTFAGLTSTDVTALSEALKRLGDPNGAAVITQWLEKR